MTMWGEFIVPLVIAFFLGTAIGMEKKWRKAINKIKFSTLLSIGAATYGIANEKSIAESNFFILGLSLICASMILQKKADARNVDSAIILWCSGIVGLLIGSDLFILAYSSTLAIIVTKFLFSTEEAVKTTKDLAANESISEIETVDLASTTTFEKEIASFPETKEYYHCQIICNLKNEANVLALMVQSIQEQNVMLIGLQSENKSPTEVKINADFVAQYDFPEDRVSKDRHKIELQKIFQNLKSQLGVNSVSWHQVIDDPRRQSTVSTVSQQSFS